MERRSSVGDRGSANDRASAGISLEVAHGFGSHGRLRETVLFGDIAGQYLAHAVGRQLAFRNLQGGEVTFAKETDETEAITSCAASRDRCFLAVCRHRNKSKVSVYELGPLATNQPVQTLEELQGRDGHVGPITAVAFSSAGRANGAKEEASSRLCVASSGRHAQIIVLNWRLNEVIGRFMLDGPLTRIAFSRLDSELISGSGPDCFDLWVLKEFRDSEGGEDAKLEAKEMQRLQPIEELKLYAATFTDHCWLQPANGTLALCTEEGAVHIVSSGTDSEVVDARAQADLDPVPYFICILESPFGGSLSGLNVLCIGSFSNGFLVAGAGSSLAVWRRQQEGEDADPSMPSYAHDCTVQLSIGKGTAVTSMDLVGGRDEVHVAVGFENLNITHFKLGSYMESEAADLPVVGGGFHSGPVTSLDMAVQRPILVSACSQDSTIRVWDYQAGRCELCWNAPEEPTSVALHPFGFFLAVSCGDRIRLMEILSKDLKLFCELSVKNVHFLRFSNGGHLLAAAQAKQILIFSARTLKKLATLRGHPREVASLAFDPLDKTLVSVGEDGKICEWSTENWSAVNEYGAHGEALAVASAGEGYVWAGAVEPDRCAFRSFRHGAYEESEDFVLHPTERITSMELYSRPSEVSLLAGDRSGNLLAFCGLTGVLRTAAMGLHADAITAVRISADGHTVATAGKDGAVFVLSADGFSDTSLSAGRGPMEVVMINRGDIQLRQDEISDLSAQISALKTQLEENAARLQSELRARVEEARKQDQATIVSLRGKYEKLQQASTVKERDSLRKMKVMEELHVKAADDQEKAYDKRMRADSDSYDALQAELRDLEARFEQNRQRAQRTVEQQELKQEKEVHRRLNEKDTEIQKLKELIAFTQKRFDAMLDQEGMEQALEVSEIKKKNQEELEQQHLVEYKLKKDQDMLVRGLDMMEKDKDRIAMEQREASVNISNLRSEAELMKREVTSLKVERKEREATLRDKEMEIGTHKVKVQTLKKFKHVLDYRLREVTDSLKPKEDLIAQLHTQLHALEEEFEKQLEIQTQMEAVLETKAQQVASLAAEVDKQKEVLRQRERAIFRFCADLHELATGGEDTRNWHIGMKKIYRDHVNPEIFHQDEEQTRPVQEMARQIQVMERKATMLALRGKNGEATAKADIIRKTQENSLLIHELEELRTEKKALQAEAKELELQLRLGQNVQQVKAALPGTETPPPALEQLPQAVREIFEEAPEVPRNVMKGSTLKKAEKSTHHKSPEELRQRKKALRQSETAEQRLTRQRIREHLVPGELESMHKRRSAEQNSVASESSGSVPPSCASVPAGPALSVVRFGRSTPGSSVDSV